MYTKGDVDATLGRMDSDESGSALDGRQFTEEEKKGTEPGAEVRERSVSRA